MIFCRNYNRHRLCRWHSASCKHISPSLMHSLEQAAGDIGLDVNTNKTEYMCFNWEGATSTLNASPLKLLDKFTYLSSSVSTTESDVNICLGKLWTVINRLSIIWKSDLSNKMKWDFFQAAFLSILFNGCTTWTMTKCLEKKTRWELHKNAMKYIEQILEANPTKQQLYSHLPPISKTIQLRQTRCSTLLEK